MKVFAYSTLLTLAAQIALADQRVIHIKPSMGDKSTSSALLQAVRKAVRDLDPKERNSRSTTIVIPAGDYCLESSFELKAEDSGTAEAPITYCSDGKGEMRLIGGKRLPAEAFQSVASQPVRERIAPEAREHVRCCNLKKLGITDLGTYPDAFRAQPMLPELYFNDQRMTLARWPNEGWATIAKVIESGPAEWRKHKSDQLGVFEYSGDRPKRWEHAPAVWLMGYWCFDWAEETIRVKHIDTAMRQITLGSKHVYGLGSGNKAERRYCAVNLLEELDSPGEYYIDRQTSQLYFWPPGELPNACIVLTTLTSPILAVKEASHIIFRGITFENCTGNAIEVNGGRNIRIENCRVRSTGRSGIVIEEGRQHSVRSCQIHDTGISGIVIKGGDRKTLTPAGHEVINNHIYRPSRRQLTNAGHIHFYGVGGRIAHNLLHDAPHTAIWLYGNDHIVEYNEIHHVANETDDCGAFYMGRNPSERGNVIRYNYWHDLGSKLSHGSCAIYLDDGTGGQMVYGNVFVKAAGGDFGATFCHGGHDNKVINNIFIDCKRAVGHAPWPDKMWKEWVNGELWHQRLLEEVNITKPPFIERYPELRGFMQPDGRPRVNHVIGNVAVRCADFSKGNWEQEGNYVTASDPGFMNMAAGNYRLRPDSIVFEKVPGFERIPFEKIGLMTNE